MKTQCKTKKIFFQAHNTKKVVGEFSGSRITSDAGALLLRDFELKKKIIKRLSHCFTDFRTYGKIEHTVYEMLLQRIMGIILGYEDVNDHDELRYDPLLALVCNKSEPFGTTRRLERDKGKSLAGKSSLNRLELSKDGDATNERYKKITHAPEKIEQLIFDIFVESYTKPPKEIILDVDATDDPLHGKQEGSYFHGYYMNYCYLPLYIFCGDKLVYAKIKTADKDPGNDSLEDIKKVVTYIQKKWPDTNIVLRGDGGFCRDEIMTWCEENAVSYLFGLAKNNRLKTAIHEEMAKAKMIFKDTGNSSRVFKDFTYQTLKSWSSERRVIGKAEYLEKGENPRFIVTNISRDHVQARRLYEDIYCARGDMENRIKEQQLYLFADRTSCATIRSNQLRLWFSSFAYIILNMFREELLINTPFERAQCHTIRLKLFKIGAEIKQSVRRFHIDFSESYPYKDIFLDITEKLHILFV